MEEVILIIHLVLALAIIGLVLLQRSEGGGLGIGGGGAMGGLASARTAASALTRLTAICAACFFATSLILGILAGAHSGTGSIMDALDQPSPPVDAAPLEPGETTEFSPEPGVTIKMTPPADVPSPPPEQPAPPTSD